MAKVESSKELNLYAWFEYTISESSTAYTVTIQRAGLGSVAWGFTMQYVDVVLSATGMADRAVYSQSFYSAEGASVEAVYLTNQVYTIPKTTIQREFAFSLAVSSEPGHYLGVYYPNRIFHWANLTLTLNALASYTITYNANSGTGAPGSGTKWYGQNYTISNTIPTRSGYTFLGWNTSSSATSPNTAYNPGSIYSTNARLTLYAVWKADYVAPVISNIVMTRYNHNIAPKMTPGTYSLSGVTAVVQNDGTITVNGTSTSAGTIYISATDSKQLPNTVYAHLRNSAAITTSSFTFYYDNNSAQVSPSFLAQNRIYDLSSYLGGKTISRYGLYFQSGVVFSNFTYRPSLETTNTVTSYDPPGQVGTYLKVSMDLFAPSSRYITLSFYKKRSDSNSYELIESKTIRYYGTRSWSSTYYNQYGGMGYAGGVNQTAGYETAVNVGDYLLVNVRNTTDNLGYQVIYEATTSATASTTPQGKVVARTNVGTATVPTTLSSSLSFIIGNGGINADFKYDIRVDITDSKTNGSLVYVVPSKYKPLDIGNGGKSFGFGTSASDKESRIDFGIELYDINGKNIKGDALSPMVISPSSTNQINHDGQLHYFTISGSGTTNKPGFSNGSILHCSSLSSVAQDSQIAISNGNTPVWISARTQNSAGVWNNWVHLVTSSDEASITAHSTSGIWEYWKFANKLGICLGTYNFAGNFTMNSQYGYSYWPGTSHGWALPFTYASEPKVLATVSSGTQSGIFSISPYLPASNPTGRVEAFIWGPYQLINASLRVYLLVIGTYS